MTPAAFYRQQLLEDCLPFWFPRCVDQEHGGFLHCLDGDGSVVDDDKSVWAQGRMSWMLLALHLDLEARPEWLEWAESGLNFLAAHGSDPADGRMYFQLARDGTPIRKRRYAFSESFAAIAWGAHAAATGSEQSASRAEAAFAHFLDWNFTAGRMPAKFTDARPAIGLAPRMIALVTAHELDLRLGASPERQRWIDRCIEEIITLFYRPDFEVLLEQVSPDGQVIDHFEGRQLNPGHALECAWFLLEEARRQEARQEDNTQLIEIGSNIINRMWQRGWDTDHGGLRYFTDLYDKPVQEYWHRMKFWWPHDEALIATASAHQLTGDPHWLELHAQVRDWAFPHFGDPEHGEWFGYLNPDGSRSNTLKGSLWKSCFHHPRALLLCQQFLP